MGIVISDAQLSLCILIGSLLTTGLKIAECQLIPSAGSILYNAALAGSALLAGAACFALGTAFAFISIPYFTLALWYASKAWEAWAGLCSLTRGRKKDAVGASGEEETPLAPAEAVQEEEEVVEREERKTVTAKSVPGSPSKEEAVVDEKA
ncbi:phosphoribosylaminoimidazole carboxylase ade2, partial [Ascosphaera pollenicola]